MVKTEKDKIEEIKKKKKELEILEKQLKEVSDKSEWIYIPELKIEIQKSIHHKNKSYNDLVKEFGKEYIEEHLPTYAQLQFLRNSVKYKEVLSLIDTWEFIKQEDDISRDKKYVAGFVAGPGYVGLSCDGLPGSASPSLGVRFVRKKLNSEREKKNNE